MLSMLHSRDVDKKEEKRAARKRPASAALTGGDEYDLEGDDEDVAESDAPATSKGEGNGKGGKAGKGRQVNALTDEGISLGCLLAEAACSVARAEPQQQWEDYECIEVLVDSGAGACVCSPEHFEETILLDNPARPSANTEYVTADGARLPNMGEKAVKALSDEGAPLAVKFQVTLVDKPLLAVSMLTAAGHEVSFHERGGTITNKANGKTTVFKRQNNVYVLPMWVRRNRPQGAASETRSGSPLSGGIRQ